MGKHISSMSTSMVGEILMKSPLGCVLKHWEDIRGDPVTRKKKKWIQYFTVDVIL